VPSPENVRDNWESVSILSRLNIKNIEGVKKEKEPNSEGRRVENSLFQNWVFQWEKYWRRPLDEKKRKLVTSHLRRFGVEME